jgi:putative DNA primase/helicase
LVVTFYDEARLLPDGDSRKAAMHLVRKLDTPSSIAGFMRLASQWTPIRAKPDAFDHDPWLATVANGTLDLRRSQSPDNGKSALCREHRHGDMLTRRLGLATRPALRYQPEAQCPNWEAFLWRIFVKADGTPDEELIAYLQRWCGYTLTGRVTEQMVLVCHGNGQNGKRTFVQAIEEVLGEYGGTISIETLLSQRFEGNAGPAELAKLDGARFVQCGENDAGRSLNEARVKLLTGNDPVPARHLRGDPFSFLPQFKLLLHTNHKPKIRGADKGIWRRVKLIPFRVTIPDSEKDADFFAHHLVAELEGILAWMVRGCLEWQRLGGLGEPQVVSEATQEYQAEEDIVAQFIADHVDKVAGAQQSQESVHAEFVKWCREHDLPQPMSSQALAERVCELLGVELKRTSRGQVFVGIELR